MNGSAQLFFRRMVHEEYTFSFNSSAYESIKWSNCGLIKAQKQDLKI